MIAAPLKFKAGFLVVAAVLITLRCIWLWQPARQVDLHQSHFLQAAQDRKWRKLDSFFDKDFRTPTGQDRAWALQQAHEVLRQFMALEIRPSQTETTMEETTAHIRSVIRIEGTGMPLAELAKSAVNQSTAPFEFTWKRKSWMPWDWRLVSVDHPLMHVAPGTELPGMN